MNNCSTAVLKIRSEMKVLFAVGKVKILQTRLYEPARLSTPPKPLFSLKLLDDAIWLRSFIIYGEYPRRDFFSRKRSLPMYETLKVSVKENEVPTEKNSSRASIFATKASYISN